MTSAINPNVIQDNQPVVKSDVRQQLATARDEISALQALSGGTTLASVANIAALRLYGGATTTVWVSYGSTVNDNAHGFFTVDPADVTSADDGALTVIDALFRRWKRSIYKGQYYPEWWGSGVTAVQSAMNAAHANANGGEVVLSGNTYTGNKLTFYEKCALRGLNKATSVYRLANGINDNAVEGNGSTALWGTNTDAGIYDWSIQDVTIDGNMANQSAGSGVAIYGQRGFMKNVVIKNSKEYGLRTEWYAFASTTQPLGMEPCYVDVKIETSGKHGWWNKGAHDVTAMGIMIVNASQTTDNLYDGFHQEGNAGGRYYHLHAWNDGVVANRQRYAMYSDSGGDFIGCHFEGAKTAAVILAGTFGRHSFDDTCQFYNNRNGGYLMIVDSPFNIIRGRFVQELGLGWPDVSAIQLDSGAGSNVSGNNIDINVLNTQTSLIDYTNSDGGNEIKIRGFVNTPAAFSTGTPHGNDDRNISLVTGAAPFLYGEHYQSYGGNNALRAEFVAAAGTVQGTATALNAYAGIHVCTSCTAGVNDGIRMPDAGGANVPGVHFFQNYTAATMKVYPATGDEIGNQGVNNPLSVASGKGLIIVGDGVNHWTAILGA